MSRWKAVLLATVATATVAPLGAKAASSLQVSLSLTPLGTQVANGYTGPTVSNGQSLGYKNSEYVAPDAPVNIYVYATISADAVDASHIAGLEYLYYNVNSTSTTSGAAGVGQITAANLNTTLGFNGFGSQNGSIGATANGLAVGSAVNAASLDITGVAKPRTTQAGIFSDHAVADGTNVLTTSTSITYLVETLKYTPNFTAQNVGTTGSSTPSTTLSLSIPTLPVSYYTANYFTDLTTDANGTTTTQLGINTGYTASSASVTLYDADIGDVDLSGGINGTDATSFLGNFNHTVTGFTNGNFVGDPTVDGTDATQFLANFGKSYGPSSGVPSGVAEPTAALSEIEALAGGSSVPEPTSLGLLVIAGVGMIGRRRSRLSKI